MTPGIDETHAPTLGSWVEGADGHLDFPIQNLPLGVFSPAGAAARGGVAIGDNILDLAALADSGLLSGAAQTAACAAAETTLNALLALGAGPRCALRREVSRLLSRGAAHEARAQPLLHRAQDCALHLPARIGDYTDFYAGLHHATNVGRQFRSDNPLLPNYKHVPIGYHGRASSVRISGAPVVRPCGQTKPPHLDAPSFRVSRRLDYELELGVWVGPGNAPGEPIAIAHAAEHIAGLCLLNDWSARDLQAWEYQPLGPFLAKSFLTTVSPWIVTAEALAPFRIPQPPRYEGDPRPLPYLWDAYDQAAGALAIELEVGLLTSAMRDQCLAPYRLSRGPASNLYWTLAQMLAHHASNGCNLNPGDLLGTGTISTPEPGGFGSLLEISEGGRAPLTLPTGETRSFLEDGDEVILAGQARAEGYVSIGFGPCRGAVHPSRHPLG